MAQFDFSLAEQNKNFLCDLHLRADGCPSLPMQKSVLSHQIRARDQVYSRLRDKLAAGLYRIDGNRLNSVSAPGFFQHLIRGAIANLWIYVAHIRLLKCSQASTCGANQASVQVCGNL